ncbi:glutathionylspermidine synthase family protein [Tistrella mobilis]|uniref:glutathionylspermidine synthase family protein n=1 Tax=Tistrella mobilis TaxID=171437 RepID=UPI0031F6294F
MRRVTHPPRPDWARRMEEELGFVFHSPDGTVYWDETAHWAFTEDEIDRIEDAADAFHALAIRAADRAVSQNRLAELGIPGYAVAAVADSWRRFREGDPLEAPVYGRLDIAWTGEGAPALLEYNAATPTSLYETAVVQWHWLEETHPEADQFNRLHEALVEAWAARGAAMAGRPIHFTAGDVTEDMATAGYLQAIATEAGLATKLVAIGDIAFDESDRRFYDPDGTPIEALFSLYPVEWMLREDWGVPLIEAVEAGRLVLFEPLWKQLFSKGILAFMYELEPDHPGLLKAGFAPGLFAPGDRVVAKPLAGREGDGVEIVTLGPDGMPAADSVVRQASPGPRIAGDEGWVYQAFTPLAPAPGGHAVAGVWIIGDKAVAMGLREDAGEITGVGSRFVPHLFTPRAN